MFHCINILGEVRSVGGWREKEEQCITQQGREQAPADKKTITQRGNNDLK
jgi:hypothetical protein